MVIRLIRHAQSEHNASGHNDIKFIDCGITKLGEEQAKTLNFNFDLIILSPLKRTMLTYNNSNINADDMKINELFREFKVDYSDFLPGEELRLETEEEIEIRVKKAFEYLKKLNQYKNIGVICHRDFIKYFMKYNFNKYGVVLGNCEHITLNF